MQINNLLKIAEMICNIWFITLFSYIAINCNHKMMTEDHTDCKNVM